MAIFFGLVLLATIGFYVSRPLAKSRRASQATSAVDAQSLEAQRESLYTQIKEVDLDHATGKVNDADYARLRADLVAQAAMVLKQIDGMEQRPAPAAASTEDDLESLIAARRKTRSASAPKGADTDVEAAIAARRKSVVKVSSESTCPECGKPINVD